ncbi:MAG: FapA family protein [Spirochaetaceae bacterium]|nr:FapA family protein [Spirochaetaceae bacterium]
MESDKKTDVPENSILPTRSTIVRSNKNDGSIELVFSPDDLEVRADLFPPIGSGEPITNDYVRSLLEKCNIVYGIDWDTLGRVMMECNLNRKCIRDVIIARGDAPADEITEYFEINPHLREGMGASSRGAVNPAGQGGRIDYRAYSPFFIVKQGQVLARIRPRKTGREGKNVHGAAIPYQVIEPEGVTGGENTRFDGKFILSGINGQLLENDGVLSVNNSLVIKGPVGYGTGNIIFPGDVIIDGPVSDGFKIYSGGSVTIKQTFDVTDANIRGDLCVAGGIIGRGRGLVKVGGILRTKFIENCRVACRKSVIVDSEIINSRVFTMENLEMGDKGMILGGDIYAIQGVRTGSVGKKRSKASRIHCGIDFTLQQEKEKNNNLLRILTAKITRLRELLANEDPPEQNPPEKRARIEELLHRIEKEREKTAARISELMGAINVCYDAVVEISGEVLPGTLIEICQIALFVTETLRRVRIRLDRANGKLVRENL